MKHNEVVKRWKNKFFLKYKLKMYSRLTLYKIYAIHKKVNLHKNKDN